MRIVEHIAHRSHGLRSTRAIIGALPLDVSHSPQDVTLWGKGPRSFDANLPRACRALRAGSRIEIMRVCSIMGLHRAREARAKDSIVKVLYAVPAAFAAVVVALVFVLAAPPVRAANTVVYRCLDARLEVVYTDIPCKEGSSFEVRPGEADPSAVARLEKLRDQLDQSAAQRISEERRLYAQRVLAYPRDEPREENSGDGGYYTYPVAGYGYGNGPPFVRPPFDRPDRPDHPDHRPAHKHGAAPPPPYFIPRR